jgi:hypothetical protein
MNMSAIGTNFILKDLNWGGFFKGSGGGHKKQEMRQLVLDHTEDRFAAGGKGRHPYPDDGGRVEDGRCHCVRLNDPADIHSPIP